MYTFDISINEIIQFADDLKFKTRIDIKSFCPGASKRIVGGFMDSQEIESFDALISWINESNNNRSVFQNTLIPDKTEFFRDPGMWIYLKENLPELVKNKEVLNIADVGSASGEEIYSSSILANELGLQNEIRFAALEKYESKITQMTQATYSIKELEASVKNYEKVFPTKSFKDYILPNSKTFQLKSSFVKSIETQKFDMTVERAAKEFDIVLCRNVLCYYSLKKSRALYRTLSDLTKQDGLLILGAQENLEQSFFNRDFKCLNEEFKVYQKIK